MSTTATTRKPRTRKPQGTDAATPEPQGSTTPDAPQGEPTEPQGPATDAPTEPQGEPTGPTGVDAFAAAYEDARAAAADDPTGTIPQAHADALVRAFLSVKPRSEARVARDHMVGATSDAALSDLANPDLGAARFARSVGKLLGDDVIGTRTATPRVVRSDEDHVRDACAVIAHAMADLATLAPDAVAAVLGDDPSSVTLGALSGLAAADSPEPTDARVSRVFGAMVGKRSTGGGGGTGVRPPDAAPKGTVAHHVAWAMASGANGGEPMTAATLGDVLSPVYPSADGRRPSEGAITNAMAAGALGTCEVVAVRVGKRDVSHARPVEGIDAPAVIAAAEAWARDTWNNARTVAPAPTE